MQVAGPCHHDTRGSGSASSVADVDATAMASSAGPTVLVDLVIVADTGQT